MQELEKSPIYNLSMCSLENFHTCFWKWLGNTYKKEFIKIFTDKKFDNVEFQTQYPLSGFKLDLLIKLTNKNDREYIIIENKLKSFPTEEQLQKYTKAFNENFQGQKTSYILTSLSQKLTLPHPWTYKSYEAFLKGLKTIFNNDFKFNNDYDKFLVSDYIKTLETIINLFPKGIGTKYDFSEKTELDDMGLGDIFRKWRTSELSEVIYKKLKNSEIKVGHNFNNKKGTIDIIKTLIPDKAELRIQIEGEQYRYALVLNCNNENPNEIREKIATEIKEKKYWFFDTNPPQKNGNRNIYKNFCGYRPNFIYGYKKLSDIFDKKLSNITFDEIATYVEKDMLKAIKNSNEITKIIKSRLENKYR